MLGGVNIALLFITFYEYGGGGAWGARNETVGDRVIIDEIGRQDEDGEGPAAAVAEAAAEVWKGRGTGVPTAADVVDDVDESCCTGCNVGVSKDNWNVGW